MIYEDVTHTIGGTPLVSLSRMVRDQIDQDRSGRLLAKLEMHNPGGSVKDRVGLALIEDAEAQARIAPGATLIEATAGNTGIGLAIAAAVKGYRLIVVMPEAMSEERTALLRHFGAEVRHTPGILMADAVQLARQLQTEIRGAIILDQFNNASNTAVHRRTTAEEIWTDTAGEMDVLVAAVGTGGTLIGIASVLKERKPGLRVVAVEPADSPVLSGGRAGQHRIPGIGVGFVPPLFDCTWVDEVIAVTNEAAFAAARQLAKREGICAGVSAGAAIHASLTMLKREEMAGKTVVAILPDTGDRYASSGLFEDDVSG
jgi:cysteine synthase A